MSTLLLVRHGLTAATGPVLAGHTPGVHLDERGQAQVRSLADRLASLPLTAVVSSPLERCLETAEAIAASRGLQVSIDDRLVECRYGEWTGKPLKTLARDPIWRVVQDHPSAARFPAGEGLADVASRAVAAVQDWNQRLGPQALWVAVSHGDVIKAVLADALGLHLDFFQRITVDPASVSAVRFTELRPFCLRLNDVGETIAGLLPPRRRGRRGRSSSDAVVGGGTGSTSTR